MEKEEAAAKEALPAASTVKPIVGVEDYALANASADWNEGAVAATAPPNWAEDGTVIPPAAAVPAAPAAALDWTVCILFLNLKLFKYILLILFFIII